MIGGKYRIESVLGEGGFGITYFGHNEVIGLPVAVKEYFPRGLTYRNSSHSKEVFVSSGNNNDIYTHGKERFLKEAATLVKFNDEPGVVSVLDLLEENNTAYLVMEYLEGETLQQFLIMHGTLSANEAFTLLEPVMMTLEKIHADGVIHRDISPDNIMRLKNGQLKLMDFGAAKEYIDETRSMSVMLKKGYAPEEQYRRSGKQGPWTDVYALCATIYRCITGTLPEESLDRLDTDELIPPSRLGADISPALEQVLLYGLAVRRKDRCPNMTELLRLYRTRTAPSAQSAQSIAQATMLADDPDYSHFSYQDDQQSKQTKKKSLKIGVICAAIILLVIMISIGIIWLKPWRGTNETAKESTANTTETSSDPEDTGIVTENTDTNTEEPDTNTAAEEKTPEATIGATANTDYDNTSNLSLDSMIKSGYWIRYSTQYSGFDAFSFSDDGTYTCQAYSYENGVSNTGATRSAGQYYINGNTITLYENNYSFDWVYADGEMIWSWTDTLPDESATYDYDQTIFHHDSIPDADTATKENAEDIKKR